MDQSSIAPLVSPWLALCGALLPSIALTGGWLARKCITRPSTRAAVSLPLALALWMLATHVIARATQSFELGLAVGSALAATPGTFELARLVRRPNALRLCLRACWGRCGVERWIKIGALALMAVPMFRDQFHDELSLSGQQSTIEQMLIGHYPPRLTFFPGEEYRYHYGFNVLAASIAAIFRVGAPLAIDLLGVVLLFAMLAVMAQIGRSWLGTARGAWLALPGLFAGGITMFAAPEYDTLMGRLSGYGTVHFHWLGPPMSSYFFQHPFALGMTLGLAAYAVHCGKTRRDGLLRFVPIGVLVVALPLSQVVFAALLGGALLVAEAYDGSRIDRRGARGALLVLAAVVLSRPLLGGWFANGPGDPDGPAIQLSLGPVNEPLESLAWLAQTYGLLLPLAFLGLGKLRYGRFAALLVIAGGLGLGSLLRYSYSWDMVKLIAVSQLMAGLAAGAFLIAEWQRAAERRGRLARPLIALAAAVVLHAGLAFPVVAALRPDAAKKMGRRVVISADWRAALELLRERTAADDLVYEQPERADMVNQFGLKVPHLGWVGRAMGYVGPRSQARAALLADLPADTARWREQGIRWFALEEDEALAPRAAVWVADGEAELVARFGRVSVIRLVP